MIFCANVKSLRLFLIELLQGEKIEINDTVTAGDLPEVSYVCSPIFELTTMETKNISSPPSQVPTRTKPLSQKVLLTKIETRISVEMLIADGTKKKTHRSKTSPGI